LDESHEQETMKSLSIVRSAGPPCTAARRPTGVPTATARVKVKIQLDANRWCRGSEMDRTSACSVWMVGCCISERKAGALPSDRGDVFRARLTAVSPSKT